MRSGPLALRRAGYLINKGKLWGFYHFLFPSKMGFTPIPFEKSQGTTLKIPLGLGSDALVLDAL